MKQKHFNLPVENDCSPIADSLMGLGSQMFFPEFLAMEEAKVQARPTKVRS